jgi:apolipoprotein N-acyltransferase
MPTPGIVTGADATEVARAPARAAQGVAVVPSARRGGRVLLLALTTGGMLYLCHFPVAWGALGWVALVPFLALVRSPLRPRVLYPSAWAGGLLFFCPALSWMPAADPRMYFTWAFLATYCALYLPLALFLLRRLERRTPLPLVVTVPAVWAALECFRANFGTGFGWYLLGHTQHDALRVIQVADLAGAYGVTFLVAAVNAAVFEVLWAFAPVRAWCAGPGVPPRRGVRGLAVQAAAVAAAVAAALGYGSWRLGQDAFERGPLVALVQCNLAQQIRNDPNAGQTAEEHVEFLCGLAAGAKPDLIVPPETSFPWEWEEEAPGVTAEPVRRLARQLAGMWQTPTLFGINATAYGPDGKRHRYNAAQLVDAGGNPVARYDKIHRVPFGEYVPLRDWLPFMNRFAPYDFDYSIWPGDGHTRFPVTAKATGRAATFGVAICYEDTDPDVARPYAGSDGKPAADFLLNISNDGWFDGTAEHEEHLAVCRFRAVECRRTVARAVNMGVSAVVDPNGRVLAPKLLADNLPAPPNGPDAPVPARIWSVTPGDGWGRDLPPSRWAEFKKVPGVLLAVVPLDGRTSLYARWGDWLPWACGVLVLAGCVVRLRRGVQ